MLYLRTYSIDCILVTFVFTSTVLQRLRPHRLHLFNSLASTFLVRVPAVFSSACSPVSLCCTSVWPRRRPLPSRCSPAPLLPHRPVEPLGSGEAQT